MKKMIIPETGTPFHKWYERKYGKDIGMTYTEIYKELKNGDLEIKVVASEANEHEWLSENFKGKWYNLRRFLMVFRKYIPRTGVVYKVYQNGELSGFIEGGESDAMKFFNESEGDVVLVKEELIGHKK